MKLAGNWAIALIGALATLSSAALPAAVTAQTPPSDANTAPTEAPPAQIATKDFAGRAQFWDAKLSPDGAMLSFMRRRGDTTEFVITDIASKRVVRGFSPSEGDQFEWYRWITNDKLLISVSTAGRFFGDDVRFTRLMLGQLSTGTFSRMLTKTDAVEGDNVIHVAEDGTFMLVAMQRTAYDYPSVLRQELVPDGKVDVVQGPREGVWNWVADENGVVRMGTGWVNRRLNIFYRPDAASELKLIARLKEDDPADRYWDALQVIGGSNEGYVLSEGENGRVGLRKFNFATRQAVETVYENPDWDLDSVTLRDGKPYAAYYTADRDEVYWFDQTARKEHAALRRALGNAEVWVVSRAKDGSRMLVWTGGEADPGVLYMYEPAAGRLDEIAQYRPSVDFRMLSAPKPVTYTARDGTAIRSYLTLPRGRVAKNLPLVILPHGGPYGIRDKLEYNDEVQLLANRGYAVLQPNFRGSGGYGDAFFELGTGQMGRTMQDDLDDAMDWAVGQGIADPARVCVVGSSYGGYAAIWAVLRNPDRYRCGASWAGVTDLDRQLRYDRQSFSRGGFKRWRDRVRGAGVEDLKAVSPLNQAASLNRPLLLAHGTKDIVVPYNQYTTFEKASRDAPVVPKTLVIKDEGHSFTKAENEQQWYDALDQFLAQHNPADPVAATSASASAASASGSAPAGE